jgi:hypothetical protein
MIQKAQTEASRDKIRMAECRNLYSGHGDLIAETRSAFLRERKPSLDKIMSNFEVTPRHCGSILLTATKYKVTSSDLPSKGQDATDDPVATDFRNLG